MDTMLALRQDMNFAFDPESTALPNYMFKILNGFELLLRKQEAHY